MGEFELSFWSERDFEKRLFLAQGEEFCYTIVYRVRKTEYINTGLGFYRKSLIDVEKVSTAVSYDEIKRSLPKGVQCSTTHDGCNPVNLFSGKTAYRLERDVATITVTKEVSQQLFASRFAEEGCAFRDYLLENRMDILKKLLENKLKYWYDSAYVAVTSSYVTKNRFDDSNSDRIYFMAYGLKDMDSEGQKYGLLLAMIEVLKNANMAKGYPVTEIKYGWDWVRTGSLLSADVTGYKHQPNEHTQDLQGW